MTALAPPREPERPNPINIDLTLPAIPKYIPRCDLATRPRAAFTRLSQLSVAGPGPSSLISPKKIRCNNNSNSAVHSDLFLGDRSNAFSLTASLQTRSSSFFASFVPQIFHRYGIQTGFTNARSSRLGRWRHFFHRRGK